MTKILVLDDEESIRSFIVVNLKRHGLEAIEAETGEMALELARQTKFALALLDVMLPGIDGFEVCKMLRSRYPDMGIIMLTAKGQEADKISGLGLGADDYIVKPFSPGELMARIQALLRRMHVQEPNLSKILSSGSIKLHTAEKKLFKNQAKIELTPTEFALAQLLMENSGRAIERDEILDEVWGESYSGDPKVVDVNIRRLRQKIEDKPSQPQYIESIWGYGYRWREGE